MFKQTMEKMIGSTLMIFHVIFYLLIMMLGYIVSESILIMYIIIIVFLVLECILTFGYNKFMNNKFKEQAKKGQLNVVDVVIVVKIILYSRIYILSIIIGIVLGRYLHNSSMVVLSIVIALIVCYILETNTVTKIAQKRIKNISK